MVVYISNVSIIYDQPKIIVGHHVMILLKRAFAINPIHSIASLQYSQLLMTGPLIVIFMDRQYNILCQLYEPI